MSEPRRCLIFGGSGALGQALCRRLAAAGGRLAFTYHRGEDVARQLESELPQAVALRLDLTSIDEIAGTVERAAEALGGLDAFVQCAGLGLAPGEESSGDAFPRMRDIGEPAWDALMAVNVKSTFFACREVIEVMRRGDGGNVLLIGSVDGLKMVPAPVHYAATKGALGAMVRAMAKEVGADGIRVNLVAPGVLEGGLSRTLPPSLKTDYLRHCGLRRLGTMDEVARLAAWLALENTYLSGQTLAVDGAL